MTSIRDYGAVWCAGAPLSPGCRLALGAGLYHQGGPSKAHAVLCCSALDQYVLLHVTFSRQPSSMIPPEETA